jgi:hypothetical protein
MFADYLVTPTFESALFGLTRPARASEVWSPAVSVRKDVDASVPALRRMSLDVPRNGERPLYNTFSTRIRHVVM